MMSCLFKKKIHNGIDGGGAWTYNWHLIGFLAIEISQLEDSETYLYGLLKVIEHQVLCNHSKDCFHKIKY